MKKSVIAAIGSLVLLFASLLGACGAAWAMIPASGSYYSLCAGISLLITGAVAFLLYRRANM